MRNGPTSPWSHVTVGRELARAEHEWLHTNGAGAYASSTVAGLHTRRYHGLLVAALDPPAGHHVFLSHVDVAVTLVGGDGGDRAASSQRPSRPRWELAKHQFPGVDPESTPFYLERFDQDPLPRWTYRVAGGELEITLGLVRGENAVVLRYAFHGPEPIMLSLRPLLATRGHHDLLREHGGMIQRVELRRHDGLFEREAEARASGARMGTALLQAGSHAMATAAEASLDGAASGPTPVAAAEPSPRRAALRGVADPHEGALRTPSPPDSVRGGKSQRPRPMTWEMRVQPRRDLPRVCFRYEGTFVGSPDWWRRFEYLAERDRGLDFQEDLWTPGVFEVPIDGGPRHLVAAVDKLPEGEPAALLEAAKGVLLAEDPGPRAPPIMRRLTVAAEAFRADLGPRPGILAGYPWFGVGARDALLALPGLYLVPGKVEGAVRVVREIMGAMVDGLVTDDRAANAATGEASLWLFEAARHLADVLGDEHTVVKDELVPALRGAFDALLRGAASGFYLTGEGLFAARRPGDALTWMAARVDGEPVTPRVGCPVELTALWARACDTLARLARAPEGGALRERASAARDKARAGFKARFWCARTGYPFDVVSEAPDGEGAFGDAAVRPNAVVALAIDPECFSPEQADAVLARARRDLVTPRGLRSLAPGEPGYHAVYVGGVASRERAYHQGTAWPWLLGAYVRAALRRGADPAELGSLVASAAGNVLALGHVAEIADGDPPHLPRGAVAQAAGVAELLRAVAWDLPLTPS
jgi:predicted glycogen debranching enzyme